MHERCRHRAGVRKPVALIEEPDRLHAAQNGDRTPEQSGAEGVGVVALEPVLAEQVTFTPQIQGRVEGKLGNHGLTLGASALRFAGLTLWLQPRERQWASA